MTPLEEFTALAWEQYSQDPRLDSPPFEGSVQRAPDDLGAFTYAMTFIGGVSARFIERAYRHYQNELTRSGKAQEPAFVEGLKLAYAEIGGFGN